MESLVERLRENASLKQGEAWRRIDGGQDLSIGAMLATEAADEIERLRDSLILLSQWMDETVILGKIASEDYTKSLREKISALLQD